MSLQAAAAPKLLSACVSKTPASVVQPRDGARCVSTSGTLAKTNDCVNRQTSQGGRCVNSSSSSSNSRNAATTRVSGARDESRRGARGVGPSRIATRSTYLPAGVFRAGFGSAHAPALSGATGCPPPAHARHRAVSVFGMRRAAVLLLVAAVACSRTISAFPLFFSANGSALLTSAHGGDVTLSPDAGGAPDRQSLAAPSSQRCLSLARVSRPQARCWCPRC